MIRVTKRSAPPAVLTTRGVPAALAHCAAYDGGTREFPSGDFNSSIYAADEVKDALRVDQHRKCAFCESRFDHTGYGDVEHYRPKAGYKQRASDSLRRPGYYWLAYEWANLFYSCQLCNQQFKRNLFPLADGRHRARSHGADLTRERPLIVNPVSHDPAAYLGFRKEYAFAIRGCREGRATIAVLGLNRDALAEKRRERVEDLERHRQTLAALRDFVATNPVPALVARVAVHEGVLREAIEDRAEYAAMARASVPPR
ncbi:hypothetical protein [Gemmata sp.]|uniref:hypothetical protein n=1 Tax=Gemmata sp. TaxID=1914242 RepID=UPI003F7157E1